jgi:hypothetical protein
MLHSSDAAQHAWLKCEKYYKIADDIPVPYAALTLNPTTKKQWFVDRWTSETTEQRAWISQVEKQVRQHWLQFYKHKGRPTRPSPLGPGRAVPSAAFDELTERLRVYKRVKLGCEALPENVDDFERYLRTDLTPHNAIF